MSELSLSPFYHSAVNAVTQPNKFTATSNYFVDRWMPLLGGNGTLIVLALRRDGFLNRKTGERRDEIVIDGADLAAAAGISEDTLIREMGDNKKTGKPQNEWLRFFVQKRPRQRRNKAGQVRQQENAYWIAMDDPIHPDDWPLVEQAIQEAEERLNKQHPPKNPVPVPPDTQSANSVGPPDTQSAENSPQTADGSPQSAVAEPQSAYRLKNPDSSLLQQTPPDTSEGIASLFEEREAEQKDAVRNDLSLLDQARLAKTAWLQLPDADRAPWLRQAERELVALHAGTGITVKSKLIEARAANLYEMSLRREAK